LLYHEGNLYSSSIFSIIIVCFIPISVTYIFGTLLTAKGNLKLLNFTAVAAVFINVLLNILLIPSYKAFGAAISSLITLSFVALTQVIISFRILKINVNLNEAGKYLLFLLLSVLLVYLVSILNQWWMLRLIFSFIAVLILGLVSGILPMNQVLIFIRQQQWGSKK
jgi:O-antigen/teichoic acid export membrane protein